MKNIYRSTSINLIISILYAFLFVVMKSSERLRPRVIVEMRKAIQDAEGREVLFVVKTDAAGIGVDVTAAARGNDGAVPFIFPAAAKGDAVIHNHPSGTLKPSSNDLMIASRLGNEGIGFYIVNNLVSRIYCVSEVIPGEKITPLDKEDLCSILLPGGLLSRELPYYEVRDPQVEMLERTVDAFNNSEVHAIEAGTGVGKSFAYLIPALQWANQNKERVIISTATINLQQQLVEKDIPFLEKITGTQVKSVLVKGRGNYVCLRRLEEAVREQSLFQEETDELKVLYRWSAVTKTGSRSDLSFMPDRAIWGKVCSESDACMGMKCPYRERCFVMKARKEASSARILVVNHHLLFSDLAMRISGAGFDGPAVLPPFTRVVFDEAHTLEKSATSFFSETYSKFVLLKSLNALYGRRRRVPYGVLEKIKLRVPSPDDLDSVPALITKIRELMESVELASAAYLGDSISRRLRASDESVLLDNLLAAVYGLHGSVVTLIQVLHDGAEELLSEADDDQDGFTLKIILQRLQKVCRVLDAFQRYDEEEGKIFWIERKQSGKKEYFFSYSITPLDISSMMKRAVYETQSTVVFTSATLTVQKKFTFWKERIGLNLVDSEGERGVTYTRLQSPFEYRKQVLLGIPADAPDPGSEKFQEFVSQIILKILELSEGKGLVLCTSYSMLGKTYHEIRAPLEQRGITVMKQGDADRARLLAAFNTDISSVLFATNSFWEGVDVPGDSLKVVIICKLPFRVPSDPIVKARMERIELSGGNPFFDLSLPEAAMRLKQGFGRLMRRKDDRGIVVILDPRIIRKSYGKVLLESLPETALSIVSAENMLPAMEDFLYA